MSESTREQKLEAALQKIAKTPLWSEPIKDTQLREEYEEAGEYSEEDKFTPSSDTECNYLRDAVETARAALGLPVTIEEEDEA